MLAPGDATRNVRKDAAALTRGAVLEWDGVMFKSLRRSWPFADTAIETVVTAAWMGLIAYGLFRLSELAF
jgi:hypothetical protein